MKVRFIHCSDLHLGAPYSMLPREAADRRRADQRETFARIIDLALRPASKADLLLISGDLFDSDHPSPRDVAFVRGQLQKLAGGGVRTFIIPGNHDPWCDKGFWSKADFSSVRLFTRPQFEFEQLPDLGISVCGIAPDASNCSKNQLAGFDSALPSRVSILLCHGSWLTFADEEMRGECHPFSAEDVRKLPFRYVALGHYHAHRRVENAAIYPGTPEAVGFSRNDLGDRFVVVGTIDDDGSVEAAPQKINVVSHVMEEFDCTAETYQSLRQKIERLLSPSNYVRIVLKGRPSADVVAACEKLSEELADLSAYLSVESRFSNVASLPSENIYLKRFVEKMNARIQSAPEDRKPLLGKALEMGVRAFMKE